MSQILIPLLFVVLPFRTGGPFRNSKETFQGLMVGVPRGNPDLIATSLAVITIIIILLLGCIRCASDADYCN